MEWWESLGAYYSFMPQAPALAHDLAMLGLPDGVGAVPSYLMAATPTEFNVYPPGGELEG